MQIDEQESGVYVLLRPWQKLFKEPSIAKLGDTHHCTIDYSLFPQLPPYLPPYLHLYLFEISGELPLPSDSEENEEHLPTDRERAF